MSAPETKAASPAPRRITTLTAGSWARRRAAAGIASHICAVRALRRSRWSKTIQPSAPSVSTRNRTRHDAGIVATPPGATGGCGKLAVDAEAAPTNPYEVYCTHCRVSFPVGTRVCVHCGQRIGRAAAEAAAPVGPGPFQEDLPEEAPTRSLVFSPTHVHLAARGRGHGGLPQLSAAAATRRPRPKWRVTTPTRSR